MKYTPVRLTDRQSDSLGEMVDQSIYPNVSEAIRAGIALIEDKHGIHGKPGKIYGKEEVAACPAV